MITALNLLMLGVASGILGLWTRALLLDFNIIKGFEAGLWVCAVVAAVYAAAQLLYRTCLLLLKPTQALSLDVTEILAHASALVLIPSLLGFGFRIPYATLQPLEPLAHLAAFGLLMVVFRLMTFFAAIYGEKASRGVALYWGVYTAVALLLVLVSAHQYLDAVSVKREIIKGEAVAFAAENTYASAYPVPENKRVIMPLEWGEGDQISLLCAPRPDNDEFPESVYVIIETYERRLDPLFDGVHTRPDFVLTRQVQFEEQGWTSLAVSYEDLPAEAVNMTVSWTVKDPEGLRQRLGVLPPDDLGRTMMVSGPWVQRISRHSAKRSVIVLLVEGLGAENMSLYGYERQTTPALARHAADMVMYEEVYTPTPEARGAAMSLLTGLSPLSHGFYETGNGPLPNHVATLAEVMSTYGYFTAAFTEGRGMYQGDLVHGSGFERGFVLFDDYFPLQLRNSYVNSGGGPQRLIPAGARVTLEKAADWVEANQELQYFVFVRLRELSEPRYLLRYGSGFMRRMGRSTPTDIYDTAVSYVDRQLGVFLDRVARLPEACQPIIVITSTNGFDFREPGRGAWRRGGEAKRSLFESALRIPLLMRLPGEEGHTVKTPASLVDVAPTLTSVTGISLPHYAEGANVLEDTRMREIISVMGNPIAQSMRSGKWRFSWQTGLAFDTLESVGEESIIEFIDIARYREQDINQDNIRREPQLVEAFKTQLSTALRDAYFGNTVVTMVPRGTSSL